MANLRSAVDAMCRDCLGLTHSRRNWRLKVGECAATDCPLHPVRPGRETPAARAIRGEIGCLRGIPVRSEAA